MALFILDNAKSINQLHENVLYGELLFIYAVIDKDKEAAKGQYIAHGEGLENSVKNYPYAKDAAMEQEQFDLVLEVLHENESREMD